MKAPIKTLASALVIFGMAGSASAMVTPSDVFSSVQGAIGSASNVNVQIKGDTATFTGYFEDAYAQNAAIRAAKNAGVEKVINLATPNS